MFLGIDLGTSFIKGAVLDLTTGQIDHVYRVPFPDPLSGPSPLFSEFDPAKIIAAVKTLLDKLLPLTNRCEGIVMTSQMHSLIFTTPQGEARSNLINWQDKRDLMPHPSGQGTFFDVLRQRLTDDERRQLGNEYRVGLPIGFLNWYIETGQPLPSTDVASLPDFVVSHLCGTPPMVDLTNAAATCLLNLETQDWHYQLIEKLGLQHFRLPSIQLHGTVIGKLAWNGQTIPIYTPVGDHQCALVGSLLRQDELSLNISTGSQAGLLSNKLVFGNYQTRFYFDGMFVKTVTNIPAGRALTTLVNLLSELALAQGHELADPWGYITRAAEAAGPTALETNLAFFNSSVGDIGAITNIHETRLTVGHLFRSAFQNIAENCYLCASRLSPEKAWDGIVFSGGLPQKIELLRRLIIDKFEMPYRLSPHPEDTMMGLLVLATAFTGRADSMAHASEQVRAILKLN